MRFGKGCTAGGAGLSFLALPGAGAVSNRSLNLRSGRDCNRFQSACIETMEHNLQLGLSQDSSVPGKEHTRCARP